MSIPKDPVILLSFINTNLRDHYPTLTDLCKALDIDQTDLIAALRSIDYEYDPAQNRFL